MENKEVEYTLMDLRDDQYEGLSRKNYNDFIKGLVNAVMDFYRRTPVINEVDVKSAIEDIEKKHSDVDEETKQKVIQKMQEMKFVKQRNYNAGTVNIVSTDPEIDYEMIINIRNDQAVKVREGELKKAMTEVQDTLEGLNEDKNNETR